MSARPKVLGKITGLASGNGIFLGKDGWSFTIGLEPCRFETGSPDPRSMFLSIDGLSRVDADRLKDSYALASFISVTPTYPLDETGTVVRGGIEAIHGELRDEALETYVAPAVPPYQHSKLGKFAKVDRTDMFEGDARWCGNTVRLSLEPGGGDLDLAAHHAVGMIERDTVWQAEFEKRIWDDLFKLWNNTWRDGPCMDWQDWLARITISSINLSGDGHFSAYFDDGDLFLGHTIEVSGSVGDGATRAQIVG